MSHIVRKLTIQTCLFNYKIWVFELLIWACTWQNQQNDMCAQQSSDQPCICPVWSASSLSAWKKIGSLAILWAHSEDSDQIGRMPRLIWVFAGHTSFCWFCHAQAHILFRKLTKKVLIRLRKCAGCSVPLCSHNIFIVINTQQAFQESLKWQFWEENCFGLLKPILIAFGHKTNLLVLLNWNTYAMV